MSEVKSDMDVALAFHEDMLKMAIRKAMNLTMAVDELRRENAELKKRISELETESVEIKTK